MKPTHLIQGNFRTLQLSSVTPILPFLYQTRTLQLSDPISTRKPHPIQAGSRQISTSQIHKAYEPIPFENSTHTRQIPNTDFSGIPRRTRESTITAPEKRAFERLFAEIISNSATKLDSQNPDPFDDDFNNEIDSESDLHDDLNAIFEEAIRKDELVKEAISRRVKKAADAEDYELRSGRELPRALDRFLKLDYERFPPSLRMAATKASEILMQQREQQVGLNFKRVPGVGKMIKTLIPGDPEPMTEYEQRLAIAQKENEDKVIRLLDAAESDVQIWTMLEQHVFSAIKKLIKEIEQQQTKEKKARKRAAKAAQKAKRHISKSPPPLKKQDKAGYLAKEEPIPLLSILQRNYPIHLLHALRLLRRHHPTSPYCLTLLPFVTTLGPISYVLGATSRLYNELIYLKFAIYNDVHGVADLLQEMAKKGVEYDEVTLVVVRNVIRNRYRAMKGLQGSLMMKWWGLRGVEEGFRRVLLMGRKVKEELLNKELKRVRNEKEEEQEDTEGPDVRARRTEENTPDIPVGAAAQPSSPIMV